MNYRTFQHKNSGDLYSLLGLIKHKHPETRKWVDHILYACQTGNLYSRTVEDFLANFEELVQPSGVTDHTTLGLPKTQMKGKT